MPRPHRRRRPVPPFGEIDWTAPLRPVVLGEDTDWACACAYGCTVSQIQRRRREQGIPDPVPLDDRGRWPSDAELRRQNEEAGDRRERQLRADPLISSSSGWYEGKRRDVPEEDDEDC